MPMCILHMSDFVLPEGISQQEDPAQQEGLSQQEGLFLQEGLSQQEDISQQEGLSQQEDPLHQEGLSQQEESFKWQTALEGWMGAHDLSMDSDSFVVKPADSCDGKAVLLVNSIESIAQHAQHIFAQVRMITLRLNKS